MWATLIIIFCYHNAMKQPFDDTTKSYYRRFFEERGLHAIQQYEVFSRSRSIDLVVESKQAHIPQLQETLFAHFRRLNALEFKGIHDPLTAIDFNRIMMRAWGVGAVDKTNKKKKPKSVTPTTNWPVKEIALMLDQRTVTIVCVTRPDTILDTWREMFAFRPTDEPGIYCNNSHAIPVWIIHPSELVLKPQNYPLLPLARGKKLQQFVELCVQAELSDYLQLTLDIGLATDPSVIWQKIMEMVGMQLTITQETWPYIDEFFQKVPEALDNLPYFRATVEEWTQQQIQQRVQVLQAQVREEVQAQVREEVQETRQTALAEGQRVGKAQGALVAKQEMLLRVLQRKFGTIASDTVELIQGTTEQAQLEAWLDQAITADSLLGIEWKAG